MTGFRMDGKKLYEFARQVMLKAGCDEPRADIVAKVLVEADMRGIPSHGVARLKRYVDHINSGMIIPHSDPVLMHDNGSSAVIDGRAGVGQYVAQMAINEAIKRAAQFGTGMVAVRNSNHFGIVGYYAEQCAFQDMIGIAVTNTGPYVVPTFGCEAVLGTNPICVAFPTESEYPVLIDMATSVVSLGKLEVCARNGHDIPEGWTVDENGQSCTDPSRVIRNLKDRRGGGILALGGQEEEFGGHKGFGLALMVELLTAGLSLGTWSAETYKEHGGVCHFFTAVRLDAFGNAKKIKRHITGIISAIRDSRKAAGAERVYIHGEKEYETRKCSYTEGVSVDAETCRALVLMARQFGLEKNMDDLIPCRYYILRNHTHQP